MTVEAAIKNYWKKTTKKARRVRKKIVRGVTPTRFLSPINQFIKAGHNDKIYNTPSLSISPEIFIFGGYLGESAKNWLNVAPGAKIQVFEPVPKFACQIKDILGKSVKVNTFGIARQTQVRRMAVYGEASSGHTSIMSEESFILHASEIEVNFRSLTDEKRSWPTEIDVMEINIEGGEFELIELLDEHQLLSRIGTLFVQFHDIGEKTREHVESARQTLRQTHRQLWSYDMVWECWVR